ncbi:chromatin binding protein [Orbilia blumenaviensis]|uniref:Chromatin binding protein n=1 Tax=Orbilia blumenaviensis TaxID=1796055 RepID=A0AAV9UDH5_9PEZI
MNLSLADPFSLSQDYPEVFSHSLHYGHSSCVVFNRRGDLLASGRHDGTVVLFDVETGGLARIMRGHTRSVQSISWSHDGRYLLSSSLDCKCILWDLEDGSRKRIIRFEAAVYYAELHPFNHNLFAAAIHEDHPWLVDISTSKTIRTKLSSLPRKSTSMSEDEAAPPSKSAASDAKALTLITLFDSTGQYIITATTRGWVNIVHTATQTTIFSSRVTKSAIVTGRLSISGRSLIFNSRDRILRTVHMPALTDEDIEDPSGILFEVEHTYQDLVNRLYWNHCDISPTGEYICASTYMNHDVYIWETNKGSLVKILEGPKEELGFVDWHPTRPMIVASGLETGRIYIWATNNPQRWSALAPDFQEVEENVEYIEKEDEFDYKDRAEMTKARLDREDEEVDLIGMDDAPGNFREEEKSWTMPVLLDIEESSEDDDVKIVGPTAATSQKKKKGGSGAAAADKKGKKRKAGD